MSTKKKTKTASKKSSKSLKARSAKNSKKSFIRNGHVIKWSPKWKGWAIYKNNRLVGMKEKKTEATAFAAER